MPDLVRDEPNGEPEWMEDVAPSRERWFFMAFTALLSVNLVVVFGVLTFYALVVWK